jgi:hypothetical protein
MSRVKAFTIRAGDYGHELDFYVIDEDGAAYTIPEGATVTFEVRLDGELADLFLTDTEHVTVVDEAAGHLRYTVQDGDFDLGDDGSYWCRMVINTITTGEVGLTVLPEQDMPV